MTSWNEYLSWLCMPHFLWANDSYSSLFGMNPEPSKHSSEVWYLIFTDTSDRSTISQTGSANLPCGDFFPKNIMIMTNWARHLQALGEHTIGTKIVSISRIFSGGKIVCCSRSIPPPPHGESWIRPYLGWGPLGTVSGLVM